MAFLEREYASNRLLERKKRVGLFVGLALIPALGIEQIAVGASPRELLYSPSLVGGSGTFVLVVLMRELIVANLKSDEKGECRHAIGEVLPESNFLVRGSVGQVRDAGINSKLPTLLRGSRDNSSRSVDSRKHY
jgi:hypothetical protein